MKSKEEYEKLIDDSCLFDYDKDHNSASYSREVLKMIEYLYMYLMLTNTQKYQAYGLEIVETAKYCINSYKSSSGRFLNYFLKAWKNNYSHIVSKELMESEYSAIRIPEKIKRDYIKYRMCCSKLGIDTSHPGFDSLVSEYLGISIDDVRELKELENAKVESLDTRSEVNDKELVTQVPSDEDLEDAFEHMDISKRFLDHIEYTFSQIQERQKKTISMILTSVLALEFEDEEMLKYFMSKKYFNSSIYDKCISSGEPVSNKTIADMLGVKESSISRTWKGFKIKIQDSYFK